jgi:Thioredoxin domain-containing protein
MNASEHKPNSEVVSSAPQFGVADQVHLQQRQKKTNFVLWGIFALLLALTGAVFFVLPRYVQPPDPSSITVVTPVAPQVAPTPGAGLSPFQEAQLMRQRQAAQEVLQQLLEVQHGLEAAGAPQWAAEDFDAALAEAAAGDEAYRTQNFEEALNRYQAGLEGLQAIENNKPAIRDEYLAQGNAALEAGDSATAQTAFETALIVDPNSDAADIGLARAKVLDQVLPLLESARNLRAGGQLQQALDLYQQVRSLDPNNPEAPPAISELNAAIAQNNFAAAMSRGYAALQRNDPSAAREAFNQAAALRPGSEEVATALRQVEDQETFASVTVHINAAQRSEAEEDWAAALASWRKALEVDPNLVSAQEGIRRSESRNNLDTYLENLLANPLTLAEANVAERAAQVLRDVGRIPDAGPKLQRQSTEVARLLDLAQVPATVELRSDGQTSVTLYRVGELGVFQTHSINLLPGNYVAVGVRPGYRDVRQEFTVPLEGAAPVVTVICTDKI